MSDTPDYAALVKLLPILRNCVDGCGEITLTVEEAERIQSLGFTARAGLWKVPPVPPELASDNPFLEHLSIGWKPTQAQTTPSGANAKNHSCEVTQIIEGNCRSASAASKVDAIRQPINVSERKADLQATAANRIRSAPARTIQQDLELAVPSEHTGGDGAFPRRRRAGYQLPRTLQEQDRMAEEAASKIVETLQRAGKLVSKRRLQQLLWRYPATIFNSALSMLARQGRIFLETM